MQPRRWVPILCALLGGAGCASRAASSQTASTAGVAATPSAVAATAPAAPENPPPPAVSATPPRLTLSIKTMQETTGGEFGLSVPMLLLRLHNPGPGAAMAPRLGVDMLLSLEVVLRGAGRDERRRVSLRLPWTVSLQELPAGEELLQGLSPLSREQKDVPLPLGRYQAQVCVLEAARAMYPSSFTQTYGGSCSNQLEIAVSRRR